MTREEQTVRRQLVIATALVLGAAVILGACSTESGPDLEVTGTSVRLPPGPNTAMYFTVANTGNEGDRLIDAACTIADCEVHESYMEDGLMQMRQVEGVDVAPGDSVSFEPGGLHVMLIGVGTLELGQEVTVELIWEKSGTMTVTAPVESYGEMGG
jgi:copper(I)-binding protein